MRLNARLDDEANRHVEYLTQVTGQSVSQVVRDAVKIYSLQKRAEQPRSPMRFLAAVGQGDSGRSDLASRYKELIAEDLAKKHGLATK